jgi:hypothetical protein
VTWFDVVFWSAFGPILRGVVLLAGIWLIGWFAQSLMRHREDDPPVR